MNSLIVTLVGMFVVFCALLLIILCIVIYSRLIRGKAPKNNNYENSSVKSNSDVEKPISESNVLSQADGIDPELLAVITAAAAACMQGTNTGYMVRSIKRIGHTTPIWNVAGRNEYILSRL
ncbi:MAG TPA: OadG family protein [Clostridia bacterium]